MQLNSGLNQWVAWAQINWPALAQGAKLEVPSGLPHPCGAGFSAEGWAAFSGQSANWVLGFADGSRLHVHEFSDGTLVVHRDKFDPNRGLGHLVAHLVMETPAVPVLLLCGALAWAATGIASA